jgi:pyruvate/2-oxoglutarate dehydrogenase complex dihydrolipoamide dehydrogenase (E3) component
MIGEIALVIELGANAVEICKTIHPNPLVFPIFLARGMVSECEVLMS